MASVGFSPKSRQDLLDIGDYIAKDSRTNARRFVAKLLEQCQRIANAPLAYVRREDLAPGLRMAALGNYVIFSACLRTMCASSGYCTAHETCQKCSATRAKQLWIDLSAA